MKRANNWPRLLAEFVEERRRKPFDWATNNCAFFACDWIARLTGVDPAADFRERVDSALSATREVESHGGIEQIAHDACARWTWPETTPHLARRGDVAMTDTEFGKVLGVVCGRTVAHVTRDGLAFVPLGQCSRAWRIA